MADKYETLVRWYLRFNGYLTVENYVIHEPRNGHIPEGGEFDTLAVRFPYSREQVDQKLIRNDVRLDNPKIQEHALVDFVIAEVKSGQRNKLNNIWRPGDEALKVGRIKYLLRWIGSLDDEKKIDRAAVELQEQLFVREGEFFFRLVYFTHQRSEQAVPKCVPQITFREIAEFIVTLRTPCWKEYGVGVRSAHEQWDKLIRDIWTIGSPDNSESPQQKVESILALLQ